MIDIRRGINQVETFVNSAIAILNQVNAKTTNLPGDPSSQATNNSRFTTLDNALAALYTAIVTNRLDNVTYGLYALKLLIDTVKLDTADIATILAYIGTPADDESNNTVFGKLYLLNKHIHPDYTFCIPELADAIILSSPGGGWAGGYGTRIEFVALNERNYQFDFHFMSTTGISATAEYIVGIFEGAGNGTLRHPIPLSRSTVQAQEGRFSITTKKFDPNTRITLALASNAAGVSTTGIKISGHPY